MTTQTLTRNAVRLTHAKALKLTRQLRDHDRRVASDHLMVIAANYPNCTAVLWTHSDRDDETVIELVAGKNTDGYLTGLGNGYTFDVASVANLAIFAKPQPDAPDMLDRFDLALVRAWVQTNVTDDQNAIQS